MSARHLIRRAMAPEGRFKLPCALPAGERVLWQGAPGWRALARNALHLRGLALYFGLIVAWVGVSEVLRGGSARDVAIRAGSAALAASVPIALGVLYAWLAARGAAYTITNRRVIVRMGVALTISVNLPFTKIDGVALAMKSDGTGDIALKLAPGAKGLGWMIMWPHSRAWYFGSAQPLLRCLPDAVAAGQILARAIAASAEMSVPLAPEARIVDTAECHADMTSENASGVAVVSA